MKTIPLVAICESPNNPRKRFGDLSELVASIHRHGVLQPVLVRPDADGYELVVGHRRFRAALEAGLDEIPADVRELSDLDVLEVQLVENFQREDVHPLEEADALAQLHNLHGYSAEDLAVKLGKSASYVYGRLRLRGLCEEVRTAWLEGRLSSAAAPYLARLESHDDQREVLQSLREDATGSDARWAVERTMRRLAEAPWSLKDEQLVAEAGACVNCPRRTGAQTDLFGAATKSDDRCTDGVCWSRKMDAHWSATKAKAEKRGLVVLAEKDSKKLFSTWGSLNSNEYVDLDSTCHRDEKYRKYRALVPPKCADIVIARDQSGRARELIPKRALAAALKTAGKFQKNQAGGALDALRPKASGNAKEVERRVRDAVTQAVLTLASTADDATAWRVAAQLLVLKGFRGIDAVAERRFPESAEGAIEDLECALPNWPITECKSFALEALFADARGMGMEPEIVEEVLGIDITDLRERIMDEVEQEKVPPKARKKDASSPRGRREKLKELKLEREEGWLYYVDKSCNIARSQLTTPGKRKKTAAVEVVVETGVAREEGYLYFLDEEGDLARTAVAPTSPTGGDGEQAQSAAKTRTTKKKPSKKSRAA